MDLCENISKVTFMPLQSLQRMTDLSMALICDQINSDSMKKNKISEIDIGIGRLSVYFSTEDNIVKYKFIPNNRLSKQITETLTNKESPLVKMSEQAILGVFEKAYKDLL